MPRKGIDVLIEAAAELAPTRPGPRSWPSPARAATAAASSALAERRGAPVRFLGRVADDDLPALYGCADVFAMLCRNRWGGLEQEGFGIVFLEAAAVRRAPGGRGQRRVARGGRRRRDRRRSCADPGRSAT